MKLQELLDQLKEELEIDSVESIDINTDIIQLDEWDSMNTLVLINYIKLNFDIDLTLEDIGESLTINDLINFIELKGDKKIIQ